jgi:hypothetical protein
VIDEASPDAVASRRARSREAFASRFPELDDALERAPPPRSRVVGSAAGGDLNLDLGHALFYREDAVRFAETQLAKWRERPGRFYMEPPSLRKDLPQMQDHVAVALYEHFRGRAIAPDPEDPPSDGGGYLLVYGIGLGLHLPALFRETPVRHIILIEEHFEFLAHSLGLVEWAELLERLDANGQTLNILIGEDPAVVEARVHWLMRGRGFGLIDGSYIYSHYRSTMLDLAHKYFVKDLPLLPVSIGYWEDEQVMLENGTANLCRYSFRLLDIRPRLQVDIPAFIVGSGPSLDASIEHIKRLRGQAVIFSSGTALQPLLRHGIRPDFHCELENGWGSTQHVFRAAERFDLTGITLIASTTVHPIMPALFDRRIFYFRDSVASTPLWCPDGLGIHGTAPTCTNLALRAALIMAFQDIYLFGIDLGARDPRAHHAKDTFYGEDSLAAAAQVTDPNKVMNIELPANFGGLARTNQILHWARMMMAQAIEVFSNARIYNCSDGASIPGTMPKLARSIRLDVPANRRDAVVQRLWRDLAACEPGQLAPAETLRALQASCDEQYRNLANMVDEALRDRTDFVAFYERVEPLLDNRKPARFQKVFRAANVGTLMMCFQIGYYFYNRIPRSERGAMTAVFLRQLGDRLAAMQAGMDELLARLASEAEAPRPHPVGWSRIQEPSSARNLALGRPARQSTLSRWSSGAGAGGAVSGRRTGYFNIHTEIEDRPWWEVDLGEIHPLTEIRVYNRVDSRTEAARSMAVLISTDGQAWRVVHEPEGRDFFGVVGGPLRVALSGEGGRYVRLELREREYFHLDQVEVY